MSWGIVTYFYSLLLYLIIEEKKYRNLTFCHSCFVVIVYDLIPHLSLHAEYRFFTFSFKMICRSCGYVFDNHIPQNIKAICILYIRQYALWILFFRIVHPINMAILSYTVHMKKNTWKIHWTDSVELLIFASGHHAEMTNDYT